MWVGLVVIRAQTRINFTPYLVLEQINERADWLVEMEALGEGKKHSIEIHDQISERLHRIRALETKIKLRAEGNCRFIED